MLNENTKIQFSEIIIMYNKKLPRKIHVKQNCVKGYTTFKLYLPFFKHDIYYLLLFTELGI